MNLLKKLRKIDKLPIPRAIFKDIKENKFLRCEMHGFCESSLKAYSDMVFFESFEQRKVFCSFAISKIKGTF